MVLEDPNQSPLWPAALVGIGVAASPDEPVLPYDPVFIGLAAVVLLTGLLLLRAAGPPGRRQQRTVRDQGLW